MRPSIVVTFQSALILVLSVSLSPGQVEAADLAEHVLHIGFADAGLAAHRFDETTQTIGEIGCHGCCKLKVESTGWQIQDRTLCG